MYMLYTPAINPLTGYHFHHNNNHMCIYTTAEELEKFGILQWQGTSNPKCKTTPSTLTTASAVITTVKAKHGPKM
jgi:hypothetical protein